MPAIEIANVWKQYQIQTQRPHTLKEMLLQRFRSPASRPEPFWALQDVSFDIEQGETFAVIGDNGSGKSTLLKLITGITKPTRGHVGVNGRISALLELGAGFHPDFTGRENVFLNGAILGLKRREIEKYFDSIVAFSELEPFIDAPVKTYSSGMYMRLAFSIAIHIDPDILVVDEILAVGDAAFQQKCMDQIHRFKHQGKTIVFVSHSLPAVRDLCQRAAWINRGQLLALGSTEAVLDHYTQQVATSIEKNKQQVEALLPDSRGAIRNIRAFGPQGGEQSILSGGTGARFEFQVESALPPDRLDIMARLVRTDGVCCYDQRVPLAEISDRLSDGPLSLQIPELRLNAGTYYLQLSLSPAGDDAWLDEKFFNFAVESPHRGPGVAPLEASWSQRSVAHPPLPRQGTG